MSARTKKFFYFGLLIIGLVLRIGLNFYKGPGLAGDDVDYYSLAVNLLKNFHYSMDGVHLTAFRSPLFSLIIAGIFKLFGTQEIWPRIFLCFIDIGNAILIYLLGKKLFSERVGFITGLFWIFNPLNIYFTFHYTIDLLLVFELMLFLLFVLDKRVLAALSILAITALTKSIALYLMPIYVAFLFIQKVKLKYILIGLTIFFVLLLPWGIYNKINFQKFSFGDSGLGIVFWGAHNEQVFTDWRLAGTWRSTPELKGYAKYAKVQGEYNKSKYAFNAGLSSIKANLNRFPALLFWKFVHYWNFCPLASERFSWGNFVLGLLSFGWLLPFFIYGIFKFWSKKELFFIWIYLIYFNLVALTTYGSIRMRLPVTPLVMIIAFAALFDSIFPVKKTKRIKKKL